MDHPGLRLKALLQKEKISYNAFAKAINVPTNRIAEICGGRRSITADTALRLGRALRTDPGFWLSRQGQYDLFVAEKRMKQ